MKNILIFIAIVCSTHSCANNQPAKQSKRKKISIEEIVDSSKNDMPIQKNQQILKVLSKMKKKDSLNESDYFLVNTFLLTNNDEALSEEAGYTFYEFFKKNENENLKFRKYLNRTENKLQILNALVEIMCLDLGEDNYTIKKLEKDFRVLENEKEPLKAFAKCIGNI